LPVKSLLSVYRFNHHYPQQNVKGIDISVDDPFIMNSLNYLN